MKKNKAFSLLELSIVILIIGVLIAGISSGLDLYNDSKLTAARQLTQSSRVGSIKNLTLWMDSTAESSFDKNDLSQFNDEPSIGTWFSINPQLSNKIVATQTSQGSKPLYVEKAINSLPALRFTPASNSHMSISTPSDVIGSGIGGATAFFVAMTTGVDVADAPQEVIRTNSFVLALGNSANQFNCGRIFIDQANAFGAWIPNNAPKIEANSPVICSSRYDGSNIRGLTNGSIADAPNAMTANLATATQGIIGRSTGGNNRFNGFIGEIIIYDRALKDNEMDLVESYLSKKWSIKVN